MFSVHFVIFVTLSMINIIHACLCCDSLNVYYLAGLRVITSNNLKLIIVYAKEQVAFLHCLT